MAPLVRRPDSINGQPGPAVYTVYGTFNERGPGSLAGRAGGNGGGPIQRFVTVKVMSRSLVSRRRECVETLFAVLLLCFYFFPRATTLFLKPPARPARPCHRVSKQSWQQELPTCQTSLNEVHRPAARRAP